MALLQKAYLGATPLFRNTSYFEDNAYALIASGSGTAVAPATIHTKGSWVQLLASSPQNASMLYLAIQCFENGADASSLLDIGIGASGSETVLIGDIACGGARIARNAGAGLYAFEFDVPIQIPSGSRLSARIQTVRLTQQAAVTCLLIDTGDYAKSPTSVDVIGVNTATSEGTNFVSSDTYVELTAATSRDYRAVVMLPNVSGSATNTIYSTMTLAKGVSGSEVEIGSRLTGFDNIESVVVSPNMLIPHNVPSGTRLAVKASSLTGTIANYGVSLIGIP